MTEVWVLAMAGALVLLALVGLAVLADRPRAPRPDPVRLRAAAEELAGHALRIRTEAGRAAAVATEARSALTAAARARDEAWSAQEAAEWHHEQIRREVIAAREAAARHATTEEIGPRSDSGPEAPPPPTEWPPLPPAPRPAPPPVGSPADGTGPDRIVSRAALSAYRRGDISLPQFRAVFRRAGDWDPLREERDRTLDRARIELTTARREYDRAAAAVRRAERSAWVAEVAARALLEEAERAGIEADEALLMADRHTRRRRSRRARRRERAQRPTRGRRGGRAR